jgi:hypothetical protein
MIGRTLDVDRAAILNGHEHCAGVGAIVGARGADDAARSGFGAVERSHGPHIVRRSADGSSRLPTAFGRVILGR